MAGRRRVDQASRDARMARLYSFLDQVAASKIFCVYLIILGTVGLLVSLIGWLFFDRAGAAELAGVFAGFIMAVFGLYEWKAKSENTEKIRRAAELQDDGFIPR